MCGIAGIIAFDGLVPDLCSIFRMTDTVQHRGPDGSGHILVRRLNSGWNVCEAREEHDLWNFDRKEFCAAFGHRRLSILDLSKAGLQPMPSEDGKLWIIHNGEIYNYLELKEALFSKGYRFRSETDTEVILASYREWGKECLARFNGMWAFAIIDLERGGIFCARDRMGVKPFYYYCDNKYFLFASEIKQLLSLPGIRRVPHYGVLFDYLVHGISDHGEETFHDGIRQMRGGHYLWVPMEPHDNWKPCPVKYWDLDLNNKISGLNDGQYAERFLELFQDSIRLRLRSDVPIGSCLSGGLDSSGIVCVINRILKAQGITGLQKTFSSCFNDIRFDERSYIQAVKEDTNTENYCVFPDENNLIKELDHLIWHQDEPFYSASVYAQWNVFRLAREHNITVMLDGQGADEILAGYHIYFGALLADLLKKGRIARFIREIGGYWETDACSVSILLHSVLAALIQEKGRLLFMKKFRVMPGWLNRDFALEGVKLSPYHAYLSEESGMHQNKETGSLSRKLYEMLFHTNLPSLLRYEDRNSMAFSVEARVPFLDYRLIEFMFALPNEQKIRNGTTKYVYRNAMQAILPDRIRMRKDKMGFVTPEEIWMKNALGSFVQDAIADLPDNDEVFNKEGLKAAFAEKSGEGKTYDFMPWRWLNTIKWRRQLNETAVSGRS